jgi:hypothetical protein
LWRASGALARSTLSKEAQLKFVQVVLSDDQARLVAQAIPLALENSTEDQIGDGEDDLKRLAMFFAGVAESPEAFPITGRMAGKVKAIVRQAKGPAQPQSRSKRAKKRTQGQQKRDRQARREGVAEFNVARERYEQDVKDMEEAHAERVAQIEKLLAQRTLQHEEIVQVFALLGAATLAEKTVELYSREQDPQRILDAAAAQAKPGDFVIPASSERPQSYVSPEGGADPSEFTIPGQITVDEALAEHPALD